MKIEEAIEYWEQAFDKSCRNNLYQNAAKIDYEDAVWTAITALHAQQEANNNESKIVHCRECVKRNTPNCPMWFQWYISGREMPRETDNDFCSHGFRR